MSPTSALRELRPDWDSYGARALCPAACDRADALILLLRAAGIEPTVCPTSCGGVDVEWAGPHHVGSVEMLPDRTG